MESLDGQLEGKKLNKHIIRNYIYPKFARENLIWSWDRVKVWKIIQPERVLRQKMAELDTWSDKIIPNRDDTIARKRTMILP